MFKLLRSKAKIFYWVIAGSFVLFIFLAWGMQYSGRQTQRQGPDHIGSINGQKISVQEWDQTYQGYLSRLRQQMPDRTMTNNQVAQAQETVWQQLLRLKLESAQIEKLHLKASDEEILDILRNSPPPELLANYTDENGNPDRAAYLADLANPDRDWTRVEAYLRELVPRQKLYAELTADVAVTDSEVREEYIRQKGRAVCEYVGALFSDLEDPAEPTDAQIETWYNGHLDDYTQPGMVRLQMVAFPKVASDEDRADIESLAEEIRAEIIAGTLDFVEAAAIYSEDSTRDSGGDLGTFDRNQMEAPFTEAAFSLPVGEISRPVETQYGQHLIEVLEQEKEDGEVVRVHARHILFAINPGELTLVDIQEKADAFIESAKAIGFTEAAAAAGLTVVTPDPYRTGRDIPGFTDTMQGTFSCVDAEDGSISRVLQNDSMYYVVQALENIPAGPAPLADVRVRVVADFTRQQRVEMATAKLNPAVGAIKMGDDFSVVAERFGLKYAQTDTFSAAGNIEGVGYNTDFNKQAMQTAVGEVAEGIETTRGVFVLRPVWKWEFDSQDFAAALPSLRNRLLGFRQQEAVEAWFEDALKEADIKDNRSELYRN